MFKKLSLLTAVLIGLVVLGAGCLPKQTPAPGTADTKPVVAASIFPIADVAKQIAGDHIRVVLILPPGISEHTYEPTPQAVESVQGAKLFLKVGHGLDNWTDQIAKSANESAVIKDVSAGITLRPSLDLDEPGDDPHYFLSLTNGEKIAANIAADLSELDPVHKIDYQNRLKSYTKQLRDTNTALKAKLAKLPNKEIVTFHGAWYYFADEYGLQVLTTFEPFPGKEPTPQYLADFISEVKAKQVKVLFTEPQFSSQAIAQVAKDLNISLWPLDPVGGTSASTQSYLDLIRSNADTVSMALGGTP